MAQAIRQSTVMGVLVISTIILLRSFKGLLKNTGALLAGKDFC
jgi:hypothetical protein